jgi:hypothetical protein
MPVKHAFTSGKADGGDATLVQPSNWNADHVSPAWLAFAYTHAAGDYSSISNAAALTAIEGGNWGTYFDFTYGTQVRLVCNYTVVGGQTSATYAIRAQYWDGATWQYLDGATGPEVVLGTSTGWKLGGYVNLAAGAKADRQIRFVTINGNAVGTPAIKVLQLQVR